MQDVLPQPHHISIAGNLDLSVLRPLTLTLSLGEKEQPKRRSGTQEARQQKAGHRCSLSPRERAGVRGKKAVECARLQNFCALLPGRLCGSLPVARIEN